MVGPAHRWRNMFLLPLDVRLDYSIALRVFDFLHGRRDLLRGEDEPAHPRGPEPPRAPVRADPGRQVRVAFVLVLNRALVARRQERVLHQTRVGLYELERPLDLASPEDDACQGVTGPRADEIWDERARSEQRAGLSKEEAARRRHESAERDEATCGNQASDARSRPAAPRGRAIESVASMRCYEWVCAMA